LVADDADDDGGLERVEQLDRRGQRLEVARDDRMTGRVELRRPQRRGEAPQELVAELLARRGAHGSISAARGADRDRTVDADARATARTPRGPERAASSSAARASGVPTRASAPAAAVRSAAVRRGAHHSPR